MIQISSQSIQNKISAAELANYQKDWREKRAILLPKVIEPLLLKNIQAAVSRGEFEAVKHDGVNATEKRLNRDGTVNLLEMLVAEPTFTTALTRLTGKKPIGYFQGRIYNISKSDQDDWHHDAGYDYLMAMSINLSQKPYEGGSLQLRDAKTQKVYSDIQNIGPGDALIFDISKKLEHKITAVSGNNPKIAFAGWYCPTPNYEDYMDKVLDQVVKKSRVKMKATAGQICENRLSKDTVLKISTSVTYRSVGKKTLLVNLADDSQCVLNRMGSKIWLSIANKELRGRTLQLLQEEYALDTESAKMEYDQLVYELRQIGYLS